MAAETYNQDALKEWIRLYKDSFGKPAWDSDKTWWECERYKWVAIKHFQENWDINAPDLADMLDEALSRTENLLTSVNSFPKGMIVNFAKVATNEVRNMFKDLFDESRDVIERIEGFKAKAEKLRVDYMPGAKNHYQDENTITVYLWLRYPDKYYIYKFGEARALSRALESELVFKKGRYVQNLTNFLDLYGALNDKLVKDTELAALFESSLDDECYADPNKKTLTADFGFFVSRMSQEMAKADQEADAYDPQIEKEEWLELISDPKVFTDSALDVVLSIKKLGGESTCTQLANQYGKTKNYYLSNSVALAKRVHQATDCPVPLLADGSETWWPILYIGDVAPDDVDGSFLWMLRPELSEALDEVTSEMSEGHWWLNASPKIWSFADAPVGEVQSYTLLNENGNKRRIYQNFLDVRPGDKIIGYESNPVKKIVALGEIVSGSDGEKITFRKTEALANPIDYQDLKDMPELEQMEFFVNPNGSLFKVTDHEYETIMDIVREQNADPIQADDGLEPYNKKRFLEEVFIEDKDFDLLARTLAKKKNLILQGAPGTGKTFAAKRLAYAIMGSIDDSRIEFVQFHQNYSYEDFVMGYRPDGEEFRLATGIFYDFCKKAESRPDRPYFFIIDEINRGNMSKVLGELLMLIEADHRGDKVTLAYSGLPFSVPENLFIIGMMNTADRSLSMIDYALRRRFAFYEMQPAFESEGFKDEIAPIGSEKLDGLLEEIRALNTAIEADGSLGRGFRIGHSYFCKLDDGSAEELSAIVDLEIVPMLEEYWFDNDAEASKWKVRLESAIG